MKQHSLEHSNDDTSDMDSSETNTTVDSSNSTGSPPMDRMSRNSKCSLCRSADVMCFTTNGIHPTSSMNSEEVSRKLCNLWMSYVKFVRINRPVFRLVEDCFATLLNYLPSRYYGYENERDECYYDNNSSLTIEKWYSALNVWSLVHDAMESCYVRGRFRKSWVKTILPVMLSSIECFELVLEQSTLIKPTPSSSENHFRRHLNLQKIDMKRRNSIFSIEIMKALLRMTLLFDKIFTTDSHTFQGENYILFGNGSFESELMDNVSDELPREFVKCTYYYGQRTQRRIKCFQSLDNNAKYVQQGKIQRLKMKLLIGEILYILRPSVSSWFELLSAKQGDYSYGRQLYTWIISLIIDVSSTQMSNAALQHQRLKPNMREELRHRKMRLMLYLLRAPIWSLITKPTAKCVERVITLLIPIFGKSFASYLMSMLLYTQKHHFMLESSI